MSSPWAVSPKILAQAEKEQVLENATIYLTGMLAIIRDQAEDGVAENDLFEFFHEIEDMPRIVFDALIGVLIQQKLIARTNSCLYDTGPRALI